MPPSSFRVPGQILPSKSGSCPRIIDFSWFERQEPGISANLARPSLAQVKDVAGDVDRHDLSLLWPARTRRAEETSDFPDKTRD